MFTNLRRRRDENYEKFNERDRNIGKYQREVIDLENIITKLKTH